MAWRDGVLLLDKPAGPTSFQTVAIARGVLRAAWGGPRPRVGHAGSLDPLATGLLVVMVGAATRLSPWLMGLDKTYRLTARFGVGTDTLDADGAVTGRLPVDRGPEALAAALARFRGGIDQVPPAYSALKRDGERLYKLARQGRELPELAPRRVRIDRLELLATRWGVAPDRGDAPPGSASSAVSSEADGGPPPPPDDLIHEADLVVDCTSGTYVRALVRDLAAALGTLGHVRRLRRERVGPFVVTDAVPPDALRDAAALAGGLRAPAAGLAHLPEVRLRADEARAVRHGAAPEPAWLARLGRAPWEDPKSGDQFFTLLDEAGELAAVVTRRASGGVLRLAAVFAAPGAPDREGGDVKLIHLTETAIADLLGGRAGGRHPDTAPCALSLGSFDGLHLGHRRLIAAVRAAQARLGLPVSALFTFRRHPRQLLDPDGAPALLTPWRERLALLDGLGLDLLVAADFCPALARTPYDDFVRRFLVGHLGLRHMVAGHDVHLGAGRGGNAATLAALGPVLGYGFEEVPALEVDGRVVSSSAIRGCLAAGDVADAAALLGRPYALWGAVGPGDGRGDTIGFPTANITPVEAQKLLPAPGVYAVRLLVPADLAACGAAWGSDPVTLAALPVAAEADEFVVGPATAWRSLPGMLNYGRAPTFHAGGLARPRVEAHLFDFAGDLRGRTVRVDWIARLRDERRFPGVAALVVQLAHDREAALRALAG